MMPIRPLRALGVVVALTLPSAGSAQMMGRSAPPPTVTGVRVPIRYESSLPPVRMASLRPYEPPPREPERYGHYGIPYGGWYGGRWYGGVRYVYIRYGYYGYYRGWSRVGRSAGSVYTKYWMSPSSKPWTPASLDSQTEEPAPEEASDVMRIESVSDSLVRATWSGTTRPIRQAQIFLADSVQQILRGRVVDQITPSALIPFGDLASRVRYVGLTITFATGLIESTLVPYTPSAQQKP